MTRKTALTIYNFSMTIAAYVVPQLLVLAGHATAGWAIATFVAAISFGCIFVMGLAPRKLMVMLAPNIVAQMGLFGRPTFYACFSLACIVAAVLLGADELLLQPFTVTLVCGFLGTILNTMMAEQARTLDTNRTA